MRPEPGGGRLSTAFETSTQQYLSELRQGSALEQAVGAARFVARKDDVQAAATRMLEETGTIDMKQLAGAAGISRASLYRSHPDRLAVETSIVADLAKRMSAPTDDDDGLVARLEAVIEVLLEDPAGAAALAPVVAAVDFDLIAAAHRRGALDEVRLVLDQTLAQFAARPDRR